MKKLITLACALLTTACGFHLRGSSDLPFETLIPQGAPLGVIYNLYGDVIAELTAPRDGVVFGLRSRPSVIEGQWCCFFGVIDQTVDNLIAK